jgi:NAD(P)-dependent dehydrogenase (short-subunit alcohol dehydrogenase family)
MEIKDAAAVVTGAASGLGAATARRLARAGARVYALDLPEALEAASLDEDVVPLPADVADAASLRNAAAALAGPLRVLVNCAGISHPNRILGADGDIALFRRTVEVNLIGTYTAMALCAPLIAGTEPLPDGQRGIIVNTASTLAFEGQAGQSAYAASKSGVAGLTLPAARDLAPHGIRVVAVAPGIFDTPMTAGLTEELKASGFASRFLTALGAGPALPARYGRPDDFACLVESIIDQDYLNATVIRLDGGLRMGSG